MQVIFEDQTQVHISEQKIITFWNQQMQRTLFAATELQLQNIEIKKKMQFISEAI